jgi:hypothetical protein
MEHELLLAHWASVLIGVIFTDVTDRAVGEKNSLA